MYSNKSAFFPRPDLPYKSEINISLGGLNEDYYQAVFY